MAWYDKLLGSGSAGMTRAKKHVEGTAHTVRLGGEAIVVGAALGALDAHTKAGLDYPVQVAAATVPGATGSATGAAKIVNVPLDGIVAAAGLIGGVVLAAHEDGLGQDARNIGGAAAAVFAFRKARDYSATQMRINGQTPGYQNNLTFAKTIGAAGAAAPATHGDPYSHNRMGTPSSSGGYGRHGFHGEMASGEDPILLAAQNL